MRPYSFAFALSALLALAAPAGAVTQAEIDALRAQINAPGLDVARAVEVTALSLRAGPARVVLRKGRIYPAHAVGGANTVGGDAAAPREFVFVGDGIFELDPEDSIETRQLEVYTGAPRLQEPFSSAVLVIALDPAAEALRARPAVASTDAPSLERAQSLLGAWRASRERQIFGIEGAILADVLRDGGAESYFAGAFEGAALGRFLYGLDPRTTEQVSLGSFVLPELTYQERRKLARSVHREQRRGRLLGLTVEGLGQWDSWLSMPLVRDGARAEGQPSFEPEHYELEVEVGPRGDAIEGSARVRLRAIGDGSRVARFQIEPDLLVDAAFEGDRRPAPFMQSMDEVLVVLDQPAAAGATIEVELHYAGQAFEPTDAEIGKSFHLRDTLRWYPHAGEQDLATYDVRLRWPKKWELLAPGELVDEGSDGASRWQRREVRRPTLGYTFQFGFFETLERTVGDVRIVLAIDAASRAVLTGRQELLDAIVDALGFLTETFGPLPTDELIVVTTQHDFSQSMLGFITMSADMTRDDWIKAVLGSEDPFVIIAHELAHQWWGHRVPWRTYRDQWLSEALANYSAALYARSRLANRAEIWNGPVSGWQVRLGTAAATGDPIESLGPVVLGIRLDSSLAGNAYFAIVYKKGALILNMLAHLVDEKNFHTILRWLAQESGIAAVSTERFLEIVAGATKLDLSAFSGAFVYGTGVPELEYSYRSTKTDDGTWRTRVEVTRTTALRSIFRVVETTDGQLDVVRELRREAGRSPGPSLVVPFAVTLRQAAAGGEPRERRKPDAKAVEKRARGRMLLEGSATSVDVALPAEPERLTLDPDQILLAKFVDVSSASKDVLLRRGQQQALEGELDAAGQLFRDALAAAPPETAGDEEESVLGRVMDVAIALELARLALDRGADDEAESWIQSARNALKKSELLLRPLIEPAIVLVESRHSLRRGDAAAVAKKLERRLVEGQLENAEGLLLLAVAAKRTGDGALFTRALKAAEKRRAVVGDLAALRR